MTNNLEIELSHLLSLMTPHREAWRNYVWDKAQKLAESDPEMADLPARLTEAMKISSAITPSGQSKPKRRQPPATTASR